MEDKEELKALTDKQEAFSQEYVKDYNGSAAAIRAGYSEASAASIASENLIKPNINSRIQELRKEIYSRNKITVDEIIYQLGQIVRADPGEVFDDDGNLKDLSAMSDRARRSIKSINISTFKYIDGSESEKRKIELYDKLSSIDKLLKHLGGYEKDNTQKAANITIFELPNNGRDVEE